MVGCIGIAIKRISLGAKSDVGQSAAGVQIFPRTSQDIQYPLVSSILTGTTTDDDKSIVCNGSTQIENNKYSVLSNRLGKKVLFAIILTDIAITT